MENKCETFWGTKHTFGKWEIVEEYDLVRTENKVKVGRGITQKRRCEVCGFCEIKVQSEYI